MGDNKTASLAYFTDLAGQHVWVGQRVAVAARNYGGLRLGRVVEITGVYRNGVGYENIRVKVKVSKATGGWIGERWNPDTNRMEPKPYSMWYDGGAVVRLND